MGILTPLSSTGLPARPPRHFVHTLELLTLGGPRPNNYLVSVTVVDDIPNTLLTVLRPQVKHLSRTWFGLEDADEPTANYMCMQLEATGQWRFTNQLPNHHLIDINAPEAEALLMFVNSAARFLYNTSVFNWQGDSE